MNEKVKKKIKKKILVKLLPVLAVVVPGILGGFLMIAIISGSEVIAPAEETMAANYRTICTQIGVPWDIVLLVNSMKAQNNNEDIEDYNILDTALEFSCIRENRYKVSLEDDTNEEGEAITVQVKTLDTVSDYIGKIAILGYIRAENVTELDGTSLTGTVKEIATNKSSESVEYEAAFKLVDDIEKVLLEVFGFDKDEIDDIIELYSCNYLGELYGYSTGDIAIGNVSIGEYEDVEDAVHEFLLAIGFNEIGACATMGNMAVESSFNPAATNKYLYFGICQWGGGRWTGNPLSLLSYSQLQGTEWYDLQTQLNFFQMECSSSYSTVYQQMMNATDLMYATDYFCTKYEICIGTGGAWAYSLVDGKPYQDLLKRRAKAELYYAKYAA